MFDFFKTSARNPVSPASRRTTRPWVEALEGRDVPAAPSVSLLSVQALPYQMVEVTGTVTDEDPGSTSVELGGVVSDTAYPDAAGNFSLTTWAWDLGEVTAQATDDEQLVSELASALLSNQTPSLTLSVSYPGARMVTLSGVVTDDDPAGQWISFGGMAYGWASTDGEGHFSVTVCAMGLGTVTATAQDGWGATSEPASATIASAAPVIEDFAAVRGMDDIWTISGRVVDESPAQLLVAFGGLDAVEGQSTLVGGDGWFHLTVQLSPEEYGIVHAQTTDWWGLSSQTVFDPVL